MRVAIALGATCMAAVLVAAVLAPHAAGPLTITTQQFFYLLGHLSFAATFLAYAQRSLKRLRLITSVGLALGLVYNGYVHVSMPEGQNMFPSLFWLSIFLIQNVSKSMREAAPQKPVSLPKPEELLRKSSFPLMTTNDWAALAALAHKSTFAAGDCPILAGEPFCGLQILAAGEASETGSHTHRAQGSIWGALPWAIGADALLTAVRTVTVTTQTAEIWSWPYATLDQLAEKNLSLAAALKDGILRSSCLGQGVLRQN